MRLVRSLSLTDAWFSRFW
uniref:Uncharacterized protein n=1 Tax=Arundo donax TaxID=35708 RepID=A0A0A9BW54_ARUDO